ncbi:mCG65021, partial [Mus musculus]
GTRNIWDWRSCGLQRTGEILMAVKDTYVIWPQRLGKFLEFSMVILRQQQSLFRRRKVDINYSIVNLGSFRALRQPDHVI